MVPAIIGYGKMGKEIESVLIKLGMKKIYTANTAEDISKLPLECNTALDFTTPDAFIANYKLLCDKFDAVIVGTTGWYEHLNKIKKHFEDNNKCLIYGTNFSAGVMMLFKLAEISSKMFSKHSEYEPYIIEYHHKYKLDAPSGTAKTLADIMNKNYDNINVQSVRAGNIKGIHKIIYESENDNITISHSANSRRAFAEGAVTAAEWSEGLKGVYEFRDLFNEKLKTIL